MYEKDGQRYFVVDSHIHFWEGDRPTRPTATARGFINCFYDYHRNLSPESEVWTLEEFWQQSEERILRDLFEVGHVDKAIFQPTYLTDFYVNGFNTTEQDGVLAEKHPDKFIVNGSRDPRAGEAGLDKLEALSQRWDLRGVKLYTAEWKGESKGWKLTATSTSTRDRRSTRSTGTRSTWRTWTRCVGVPRPELRRRTRRPAAAGGLLLDRHAGAQCLRWTRGGTAVHPLPAALLRPDHRRAAVLILGLNVARLYDIAIPPDLALAAAPVDSGAAVGSAPKVPA